MSRMTDPIALNFEMRNSNFSVMLSTIMKLCFLSPGEKLSISSQTPSVGEKNPSTTISVHGIKYVVAFAKKRKNISNTYLRYLFTFAIGICNQKQLGVSKSFLPSFCCEVSKVDITAAM